MRVTSRAADDASDAVDAVAAFVDRVDTSDSTQGACVQRLPTVDANLDGTDDTFEGVEPGAVACFDIAFERNEAVQATTSAHVFAFDLQAVGDDIADLGHRRGYIIVAPEIP